jgi:hypothetical protein
MMDFEHVADPDTRKYLADGVGDAVGELDKAWEAFAGDEEDEEIEFYTLDLREEALDDAERALRDHDYRRVRHFVRRFWSV